MTRIYLMTEDELTSATVNTDGDLTFTRQNGDIVNAGQVRVDITPEILTARDDAVAAAAAAEAVGDTNDTIMAGVAADDGSAFAAQLNATYATSAIDSTQRLMAGLHAETQNLDVLFVGDSTGNETSEWIHALTVALGSNWPRWTVLYRLWNDTALVYNAAETIQTGTGSHTITIYNCSVAGATYSFFQGAKFATCIAALTPTLTVVSMGHNEGSVPELWHPQYSGFIEQVAEAVPGSSILIVLQNPESANTYQQQRAFMYREIASRHGYGTVDVGQAFLDADPTLASLLIDGIHPNATGTALWVETIKPAFVYQAARSPRPQSPSTLVETGAQLLTNADFSAFAASTPDGWTVSLAPTLSKDATVWESVNGYSVKIASPTTGASIQQSLPIGEVKGRWVTLATRVYVPSGQGLIPGRIAVSDSTGSTTSNGTTWGKDGWRWEVVTRYIPATATSAKVVLFGDSSSGTGYCNISQAVCVVGKYPKRAANGSRGLPGAAGTVAGQIDFMSSMGGLAGFLYGAANSTNLTIANQAILVEFRPHRDVTVNSLEWMTGATVNGNYDIGIYDAAGNLLWSKGTAGWPIASTLTAETVSPSVSLTAGTKYYLAFAGDTTTALFRGLPESFTNQVRTVTGDFIAKSVATSFPLPSSLAVGNTRAGRYPAISVHGV